MTGSVNELDFTLEFNSEPDLGEAETLLYGMLYDELKGLAGDRDDLTGAAATLRQNSHTPGPYAYEATIVAYCRPNNIAATKKAPSAQEAIADGLDAIVRQVREQREKLEKPWEQPKNDPEVQALMEVELGRIHSEEIVVDIYTDESDTES